jgi:hypothetical protein
MFGRSDLCQNFNTRVVFCLVARRKLLCTLEMSDERGLRGVNNRGRAAIRVGTRLVLNKHAINKSSSINIR